MSPRVAGPLLVLLAAGAAVFRLHFLIVAAAAVWLSCIPRAGRASAPLVLGVALLVRLPFLFGDDVSNDLHRYLWEGRIQLEGYNPYALAPDDPELAHLRDADHGLVNHPDLPAIYPPLAQMLFRGAAWLGLGVAGVRNVVLLLDLAVVGALLGWLRGSGRALVYAWCPVAVCGAAVGHYDPLMLLPLVGFAWAFERGRFPLAGGLLGAAILAKTVAVLCVPWLLLRRPRAALVTVAVVVLGYLPYAGGDLFGTLLDFGSRFAFNASLFRAAEWIGARWIVVGLLVLWTGLVAVSQPRVAHAVALLMAGLLLLSPTVHYWYLTWFLVVLPAVPRAWAWPLLLWTATVVFSFETYRAHYAGGPFEERFLGTALEYLPPAALALALLWRRRPRREALAPPGRGRMGRFAVVIPCRGEERSLRELLPAWLARGPERVVVADTPSGDGTEELARGLGVTYVPVRERGYGAAVKAGLDAADDAEFAVVCDADHGRGPDQVEALLAPFADPAAGLVAAARTGARLPLAQRIGNALVCRLIALGWGRRFHDLGPFRALRLPLWPRGALSDPGFGWNVEMNVKALELGMKVLEVPLPASERAHGRNRIGGTLAGVVGAGAGILRRLYRLREESCASASQYPSSLS